MARRNRVAHAILRALDDEVGMTDLRQLLATAATDDDGATVAVRARCGLDAAAAWRRAQPHATDALGRALGQGAVLFRAGLFFEVHELLETIWRTLDGARRDLVQGLIQVAVALHHLAHDNAGGAASLLRRGRTKLVPHAPQSAGVDVAGLLAGLAPWEAAAAAGGWPEDVPLPSFVVRTVGGRPGGEDS